MYIDPELSGEGDAWDYYKELAAGAGLTGMFQRGQTYATLITYNAASTSSAVYVFLRSCNRSNANNEWNVNSSGNVNNNNVNNTNRACPTVSLLLDGQFTELVREREIKVQGAECHVLGNGPKPNNTKRMRLSRFG